MEYAKLKHNRRRLLALTGLTLKEFKALLPSITSAYQHVAESEKTLAGHKRTRLVGGGRTGRLETTEQKLLFILVYQKTYPLQVVMGELFGLSQSSANEWIHRLLPVLRDALIALDVMPERDGEKFAASERRYVAPRDYIIDGTERAASDQKSPKNRHFITAARRRRSVTRMSSLSTQGRSVSRISVPLMRARHTTRS